MDFRKKIVFLLSITLFILASCSVEKRHYRGGYRITSPANKNKAATIKAPVKEVLTASTGENIIILNPADFIETGGDTCDTIVFKNEMEIKARILEITQTEIKYKRCDFVDGPTYSVQKENVSLVKFKNGVHEKITASVKISGAEKNKTVNLADSCVLIVAKDSTLIKGKIVKITPEFIKYTYCDGKTKNIYVLKRSFVSKILMENGTKDILANSTSTSLSGLDKKAHANATASLIFGILSLVTSIFGIFTAIAAISFGVRARKMMRASGNYNGEGMAKAGIVMGIVYLCLIALIFLIIVAVAFHLI